MANCQHSSPPWVPALAATFGMGKLSGKTCFSFMCDLKRLFSWTKNGGRVPSSGDGLGGSAGAVALEGGGRFRRLAFDGSALGEPGSQPAPGPCGLLRSSAWPTRAGQQNRSGDRRFGTEGTERVQRAGRVWCRGDSSRTLAPPGRLDPLGADDRSHSRPSRRLGWSSSHAPAGWYLPRLAEHCVALDSFDIVEGLVIQGGLSVEVLTGVSLHGGLAEAWPRAKITAKTVVSAIVAYWRRFGLPAYAQFDNDTVFQGPHQHRDVIGRVTRLCLSLDVVPVFAPPRETGFQAAIENFNGAWQAKVWNRFHFSTRGELTSRSRRFITAHRRRRAARVDGAPAQRPLLDDWSLDLQKIIDGRIIYLRRTSDTGTASLLGHTFPVDRNWPHRLVRAEVDLKSHRICFYALRRRDTSYQPMLKEIDHEIPRRKFHE